MWLSNENLVWEWLCVCIWFIYILINDNNWYNEGEGFRHLEYLQQFYGD